ncbi:hypothetical protein HOY80DRAFT_682686 [Tuber brumale]|nr:hypothetical protein HOY80DRAFT_682686 [Tuber brumale]
MEILRPRSCIRPRRNSTFFLEYRYSTTSVPGKCRQGELLKPPSPKERLSGQVQETWWSRMYSSIWSAKLRWWTMLLHSTLLVALSILEVVKVPVTLDPAANFCKVRNWDYSPPFIENLQSTLIFPQLLLPPHARLLWRRVNTLPGEHQKPRLRRTINWSVTVVACATAKPCPGDVTLGLKHYRYEVQSPLLCHSKNTRSQSPYQLAHRVDVESSSKGVAVFCSVFIVVSSDWWWFWLPSSADVSDALSV